VSAPAAAAVRERPILFSGPMVRAILDDRKTQTRRVIVHPKNPPSGYTDCGFGFWPTVDPTHATWCGPDYPDGAEDEVRNPFGAPGDRLWVREAFDHIWTDGERGWHNVYRADGDPAYLPRGERMRWRPSIHMPRAASRLTLEVTGVRVERVQAITEDDARAEGVAPAWLDVNGEDVNAHAPPTHVQGFAKLWNALNASRGYGWDANPWVWVVAFRRVEG
jgi:hypothetical protein